MKGHFLEDSNLLHRILVLKRWQINLLYPFLCFFFCFPIAFLIFFACLLCFSINVISSINVKRGFSKSAKALVVKYDKQN